MKINLEAVSKMIVQFPILLSLVLVLGVSSQSEKAFGASSSQSQKSRVNQKTLDKQKSISHSTPMSIEEIKESTVDIQGKKFRKLELDKGNVFVETLDSTAANDELRVLCQEGHQEITPSQVVAGVKVTQRTSLVVEGLRQICKDMPGSRKEIMLDPAVLVGLQIGLGKNKQQKVIVSPFGVNFKADW